MFIVEEDGRGFLDNRGWLSLEETNKLVPYVLRFILCILGYPHKLGFSLQRRKHGKLDVGGHGWMHGACFFFFS